jgi:hypothetical protein
MFNINIYKNRNTMKKILLSFLLLIFTISYSKDSASQDGDWETNSTWTKGIEPTTEDTLVVSDGIVVIISNSNLNYNTALIILLNSGGTLQFDGKLNLTSGSKIISNGGNVITTGSGNSDKIRIGNVIKWSGKDGNLSGNFVIGDPVLPVKWGRIIPMVVDGTYIKLNWNTYNEKDNDFFTIQYTNDINIWEDIMKVNSVGNSSTITYYSEDFYPPNIKDIIYVRIKQTDYDGSEDISKVHVINFYYDEKAILSYYLGVDGIKYYIQPMGFSIAVYKNGHKEKVFRIN